MTYSYPFSPSQGATITFTAAAVIPAAVQSVAGLGLYLVQNASPNLILLGWGTSAAAAQTAAGLVATALPILPYTTQALTLDRNLWFTGSATSSSVCYITAGFGL
jgi:hypothetical protein